MKCELTTLTSRDAMRTGTIEVARKADFAHAFIIEVPDYSLPRSLDLVLTQVPPYLPAYLITSWLAH